MDNGKLFLSTNVLLLDVLIILKVNFYAKRKSNSQSRRMIFFVFMSDGHIFQEVHDLSKWKGMIIGMISAIFSEIYFAHYRKKLFCLNSISVNN